MYCPTCGSEERQLSQYCRACGTDLRSVRTTLERPDEITASAVSAREQISRVMAVKIAQMESEDLKEVAEDVLPQIEKFLESPEERRLRRVRAGVITACVGLGATIITFFMALDKGDIFPFVGLGLITFLIGLGLVINGLVFTVPRKLFPGHAGNALAQKALDSTLKPLELNSSVATERSMTNELPTTPVRTLPSVTEHTTHHLSPNKS
jgi:hypothetical protein